MYISAPFGSEWILEHPDKPEFREMFKMIVKKARKIRNGLMITGFVIMLLVYVYVHLIFVGTIVMFSCLISDFL